MDIILCIDSELDAAVNGSVPDDSLRYKRCEHDTMRHARIQSATMANATSHQRAQCQDQEQ